MINAEIALAGSPFEVFPAWREAQRAVDHLAREVRIPAPALRTTGFLRPDLVDLVTDWFLGEPTGSEDAVRQSYRALERETARLYEIVCRARCSGGLGVQVEFVRCTGDPYDGAAELCDELRRQRTMSLTTIACDRPHPLLGGDEGGIVDQLRVVHDVFGHAALGLGFDLQSEFATWLQCRTLSLRRRAAPRSASSWSGHGVHRDRREAGSSRVSSRRSRSSPHATSAGAGGADPFGTPGSGTSAVDRPHTLDTLEHT